MSIPRINSAVPGTPAGAATAMGMMVSDSMSDFHEREYKRRAKRFWHKKWAPWLVVLGVAAVLAAGACISWSSSERAMPLTDRQNTILTALVREASAKTGRTSQAVWADFNRRFGIRSHDDLQRGDYERAESVLLEVLGVGKRP